MSHKFDPIDELIWKHLDASISQSEFAELEELLKSDSVYRQRYQLLVEVHHGVDIRSKMGDAISVKSSTVPSESEVSTPQTYRWLGIAASMIFLSVLTATVFFSRNQLDVVLSASRDADWRGAEIAVGERATNRIMHLMRGAVVLNFSGETSAIIEGPALFQVQDDRTIELSSGTITVHHEGKPGEFRVITPVGKFTDLGTKFGIQVGNGVKGSVVMTEVYEGEVVYDNYEDTQLSLVDGDAYAIIGNHRKQELHTDLDGDKVRVAGTFKLSDSEDSLKYTDNLALGKPVYADGYHNNQPHGAVFPPSALTDNRVNDSGSPWDWSFWLASDGDAGEATLDLLEVFEISRIELLNTRNRQYGNRGMKEFEIEVSLDGERFEPLLAGELAAIKAHDESSYEFEVYDFEPIAARFVRIVGKSYYPNPKPRRAGAGGLGEVRVFE